MLIGICTVENGKAVYRHRSRAAEIQLDISCQGGLKRDKFTQTRRQVQSRDDIMIIRNTAVNVQKLAVHKVDDARALTADDKTDKAHAALPKVVERVHALIAPKCQALVTALGTNTAKGSFQRSATVRGGMLGQRVVIRVVDLIKQRRQTDCGIDTARAKAHEIIKEKLLQLNEEMTGNRYLRGIVRVGGMRRDWTNEQMERIVTVLNEVEEEFDEITEILLSHEIAVNRMATTGILPLDKAEALEVVGVGGRASGRRTDSRIGQPYDAYAELPPQLITDEHGDVMARITVRVSEAKEAMKLIREAVLKLPAGDIYAPVGNIAAGTFGIGWSESARGENCHFVMVGAENTVYRYRIRSAAYSNWPAVALAVPGNIVPDFPLINKSFELCYACCDR